MTVSKRCLVNYKYTMFALHRLFHNNRRISVNGLQTIGSNITYITKTVLSQVEYTESILRVQWPSIVGAHIATLCLPTGLSRYRLKEKDTRILSLQAQNGSAAIELQHCCLQIIEQVNTYFGREIVTSIKLSQDPLPWRRLSNSLSQFTYQHLSQEEEVNLSVSVEKITSSDLRNAVNDLGRAVLLHTQKKT